MPFQSEKQRRYLWANEPEIARDWTDTYGSRIQRDNGGITNPRLLPHQPRDLLVQNNPYGTRPSYQPPGYSGPTGQETRGDTRGRDPTPSGPGPDRHPPVHTPPTTSVTTDRIMDVAKRKQRQDIRKDIARREAEKDYTRQGVMKPGPQLGWASGVGPNIGSMASQFAGSKIGGGLGSMLFGPWGALLLSMFGRGVGKRAYQASQTSEKERLRDILLGENTILSSMFNKGINEQGIREIDTPNITGDERIETMDITDKINQLGGPTKDIWNVKRSYDEGPWMGGPLREYGQYGMPDLNELYRLKMNERMPKTYSEGETIPKPEYYGLDIARDYIPTEDLQLNIGPYEGERYKITDMENT